jgi:hypothetical protein
MGGTNVVAEVTALGCIVPTVTRKRLEMLVQRFVYYLDSCKNIRLTESKELQFRGELFNVLNHVNFRLPVSDIESPTFGQIQQDIAPRVIQVALKFLF